MRGRRIVSAQGLVALLCKVVWNQTTWPRKHRTPVSGTSTYNPHFHFNYGFGGESLCQEHSWELTSAGGVCSWCGGQATELGGGDKA